MRYRLLASFKNSSSPNATTSAQLLATLRAEIPTGAGTVQPKTLNRVNFVNSVGRREVVFWLPTVAAVSSGLASCAPSLSGQVSDELALLETRVGGRLGVSVYEPATQFLAGHRLDERFGMCSTFKLPLAGLLLREIDEGRLTADQFIPYTEADMVPYAPVTGKFLAQGGMRVIDLAEAAQTTSDNVAANLLLRLIEGPAGFTSRLRETGDGVTRLDRFEPELNFVPQGEVRDTSTPRAMAETVAQFVFGEVLPEESRALLIDWMEKTRTGRRRIRAGLPPSWRSGDKTGTALAKGMPNKYNDIAAIWTSSAEGLVIVGYYEADGEYDELRRRDEAVLADVGRIVAEAYSQG